MFKYILAVFVLLALSAAINAQQPSTCGFTFLNAGATCGTNNNNTLTFCQQELACFTNAITSASTCTLPSSFGAFCNETAGRFCVGSAYAPLQCIANTCIYLKAVTQTCRSNADCFSNNCTVNPTVNPTNGTNGTSPSPTPSGLTGVCQALSEFSVCTNNRDCGLGLYCNKTSSLAPTGICTKFGLANEGCSLTSPCAPGIGCAIFGAFGICRAKTAINGTCSNDGECVSGVCGPSGACITAYSIPSNATCTRGVQCQSGLACNTTTGKCVTATSVSCDATSATTRCKLTNDNITAGCNCGFCFETVNQCASEKTLFASCMTTNCPNPVAPYTKASGYYPYDNSSCARNCVTQFNNLQCCYARTNTAYVKLADTTAVCTTTSPSVSASPSTNPPSNSPTPSGTVGVASISRISIATLFLAVVVAVLL